MTGIFAVRAFLVALTLGVAYPTATWAFETNQANDAGNGELVTLTTINCKVASEVFTPTIIARDVTKGAGAKVDIAAKVTRSDKYASTAAFRLREGTYTIIVGQGGCSDIFDITVLKGLARTLMVAPNYRQYKDLHEHNSVSGIFPIAGLRAEIMICSTGNCDIATGSGFRSTPVVTDGFGYYANELAAGQWYLKVSFDNSGTSVVIPISIGDAAEQHYKHLQRNISVEELQGLWSRQRPCVESC